MTFEILDSKDIVYMYTSNLSCVPNIGMLELMSEADFTFRLDGKKISLRNLKKYLKEANNGEYNKD